MRNSRLTFACIALIHVLICLFKELLWNGVNFVTFRHGHRENVAHCNALQSSPFPDELVCWKVVIELVPLNNMCPNASFRLELLEPVNFKQNIRRGLRLVVIVSLLELAGRHLGGDSKA